VAVCAWCFGLRPLGLRHHGALCGCDAVGLGALGARLRQSVLAFGVMALLGRCGHSGQAGGSMREGGAIVGARRPLVLIVAFILGAAFVVR
jgi:hypothetical protein